MESPKKDLCLSCYFLKKQKCTCQKTNGAGGSSGVTNGSSCGTSTIAAGPSGSGSGSSAAAHVLSPDSSEEDSSNSFKYQPFYNQTSSAPSSSDGNSYEATTTVLEANLKPLPKSDAASGSSGGVTQSVATAQVLSSPSFDEDTCNSVSELPTDSQASSCPSSSGGASGSAAPLLFTQSSEEDSSACFSYQQLDGTTSNSSDEIKPLLVAKPPANEAICLKCHNQKEIKCTCLNNDLEEGSSDSK